MRIQSETHGKIREALDRLLRGLIQELCICRFIQDNLDAHSEGYPFHVLIQEENIGI